MYLYLCGLSFFYRFIYRRAARVHTGADDRCDQELLSEIPPAEPNLTSDFPSESDSPSINVSVAETGRTFPTMSTCVLVFSLTPETLHFLSSFFYLSTLHVCVCVEGSAHCAGRSIISQSSARSPDHQTEGTRCRS